MIARLRGKLLATEPVCVVDVGGVGFELQVPDRDRMALNPASEAEFYTYLYVRQDRLTLFGFAQHEDRELFTRLIDVSGVGPRIAVGMIGEHPTARIVRALRERDHAWLCKMPGLGKKTAERLTVDLKDKLDDLAVIEGVATIRGAAVTIREEAVLALTALGMQRSVAERALENIDWQTADNVPDIVKEALKGASSV